MKEVFESNECDAVILVDAKNASNSLNRTVALHNIQYICPPFANILINTYRPYRHPARLVISGGEEIRSQEGTTQGDNLAMQFYGLGTSVLLDILSLKCRKIKQVWLADDVTGAGKIRELKQQKNN